MQNKPGVVNQEIIMRNESSSHIKMPIVSTYRQVYQRG